MTPEQMRVVIAEELGWNFDDKELNGLCLSPKEVLCNGVPNYPEDLNACHEMEKVLTIGELVKYGKHLNRMELSYNYGYVQYVINATAPQRCEAWIKTRCPDKWKD